MDWRAWLARHRGKVVGSLLGFALGVAVMTWGLLWTLFVGFCVGLGYVAGRYFDGEQDVLAEWIERLRPTGRR